MEKANDGKCTDLKTKPVQLMTPPSTTKFLMMQIALNSSESSKRGSVVRKTLTKFQR